MHEDLVGLDPAGARRAVQALADAQAALDGASRRVQALLDEAGQGESCTAPATIRRAALSCGAIANDLDRRIGLLGRPDLRSKLWLLGPLPAPCTTPPGVLPPPATGSTSAIVVPGPTILITPPAPRAPQVVYTTVGGQACGSTVYTTGRREGAGQPVPAQHPSRLSRRRSGSGEDTDAGRRRDAEAVERTGRHDLRVGQPARDGRGVQQEGHPPPR